MSEFIAQIESQNRLRQSGFRVALAAGAVLIASFGVSDRVSAEEIGFASQAQVTGSDFDKDGIRNDVDRRMLTADPDDVDNDGISNRIDRNVYIKDLPDADYDLVANANDRYPYLPLNHTLKDINRYVCLNPVDIDCDLIPNSQDRFPQNGDPLDADWDGVENGLDKHPYVPFAATSIYDKIIDISYFCYMPKDNDCDGVANTADPNDYVAEFPDVDGDGIKNQYDPYPYFNPRAVSSTNNGLTVKESSGNYSLPILYDVVNGYIAVQNIRQMFDTDSDGDGLNNGIDPYPYTRDWDNDGKPDGDDSQISVNQKKVEEKRLEERRQDKRLEDKRLEEQRVEVKQQDKRLEDKRLEEQRVQNDQERKRQEEKRQSDKIDAERRRNDDD